MQGYPLLLLTLLIVATASAGADAEIPPLVGETLAGHHIRLPADIVQPTAILIVGFTQKAAEQAEKWGMEVGKLRACDKEQPIEWYEMPVLSSIPRLIRPLVIRAIRSELGPELGSHFLPIYTEEESWKAAMGFSVRDDAYVAVVKRDGVIRFCLHGASNSDKLSQLGDNFRLPAWNASCIEFVVRIHAWEPTNKYKGLRTPPLDFVRILYLAENRSSWN